MFSSLPPRYFCDFALPPVADQHSSADSYQVYLQWLADHLYGSNLPLSPEQQRWLRQQDPSPRQVVANCASDYGFEGDELHFVEGHFVKGESYVSWQSRMPAEWKKFYPDPLDQEENPFDEWPHLTEEVYERVHSEWEQEQETGQEWDNADIPFRSLLSWALRQIPEQEARVQELDFYFKYYREESSK